MRRLRRGTAPGPVGPLPGSSAGAASDPSTHLVIASLLISLAILIRLGPWDLAALALTVIAAAVVAWATLRPAASTARRLRLTVRSAFLLQAAAWLGMLAPVLAARRAQPALVAGAAAAAVSALVVGWDLLRPQPRTGRWAVPAFILAVSIVGAFATLGRDTTIDVAMFQEISADRLLAGDNPYAGSFPDPYSPAASARFYGPGISVDGMLEFGYPYPPLTLLLVLPGTLLGDVRATHLAAVLAAGWLMATLHGGSWRARAGSALFLTSPAIFFVTARAWTEPFVIALLVAVVWSCMRRARWTDVLLGLFAVSKQYAVLLAPLYLLLVPRPWTWRRVGPIAARAALAGAVVTLPLALWDFSAFWWSVVELQLHQPFRPDSMSVLAVLVDRTGWPPPGAFSWLPLLSGAAALAAALRWAPRSASGLAAGSAVVMLSVLLVSKQAFTNYYFLVVGALTLAVAARTETDAAE